LIGSGLAAGSWYILYMPANLPPEYFEAEKVFKEAASPSEKVTALEALIATVPKHKGTDKLRADLRARLSRLREEAQRKKKSGRSDLYTVDKEGAAQIALVGFPNSGKSSLLKSLTNANPVIADYPMSTVMPLAGMMPYEDIQFQLVDLPPVGNESTDGWVSGILRNTDVLLIVVDLSDEPESQADLVLEQLRKWQIPVAERTTLVPDDSLVRNRRKRVMLVGNKLDLEGAVQGAERLREAYGAVYSIAVVSAEKKRGLEDLKGEIFRVSGMIRVYTKEPGKEPDLRTPFTIPSGSTVLDLGEMIHKDFVHNLKYVCIWGSSRFPGQRVQKDHVLRDRDIVEFRV
jgi:ribosome-interacting GTPase 1